jgi:hypothetical protein
MISFWRIISMTGRGGRRRGSGRKGAWQSGETQTIRVPVALREPLLEIGRHLDEGQEIYHGRTCDELEKIVSQWQANCQVNNSPEWQLVGQLLAEIEEVLSRGRFKAGRRARSNHRNRHHSCESDRFLE